MLTALDVLGYERPTRLRQRSAGLVGLVVPELDNPIFPAFAQVIETVLAQTGYTPVLCTQTPGGVTEDEYVESLLDHGVAGIIFVSGRHADTAADHERYQTLIDRGCRSSSSTATPPTWPRRSSPTTTARPMSLAVTHLVAPRAPPHRPGRRAGAVRAGAAQADGFVAALDRLLGIPEAEALGWIAQSLFSVEGGAAAASRLLAQGATAIVCGSDLMALGAIQAVRRAGLSVPGDVSVVGYDDSPLVAFIDPPLTTVRQPVQAMGVAAVDALVDAINGTPVPPHEYVFRPELVLRGSTAVAPALTPGPTLASAVAPTATSRWFLGSGTTRTSPCVSRTARSIAPTWTPPRSGRRTPRRGSAPAASPVVAGGSTPGSRKRQRPGPCAQDPVHHPVAVTEVEPGDGQVLQPGPPHQVLPLGVAGLPSGGPVVRAVELADDAGLRVEQVGHPEQPTVEVPDLLIDQGRRQPGVKHPDQPQPGLVGRPTPLAGELQRGAHLAGSVRPECSAAYALICRTETPPAAAIMSIATTAARRSSAVRIASNSARGLRARIARRARGRRRRGGCRAAGRIPAGAGSVPLSRSPGGPAAG